MTGAEPILVRHVVDACADIDERLEHVVRGDVGHPLAVDPYAPAVADGIAVLLAGPDHAASLSRAVVGRA
jgi:hypothetical protein